MIRLAMRDHEPWAHLKRQRHIFIPMKLSDELSEFQQRLAEHAISVRADGTLELCDTERRTEEYLVAPLIQFLGYARDKPSQVLLQYDTAPRGAPRAPVDFAILSEMKGNQQPFILVEAKVFDVSGVKPFTQDEIDQLKGYMGATTAIYGLLTDGNRCNWYRKPPNKRIVEDKPFLTHSIFEPTAREIEWLSAISKGTSTRDELTQLAWRLSLENGIREWLFATFDAPGNPAAINKAADLGARQRDHELVLKAAKNVWRDMLGPEATPPPPPPRQPVDVPSSDAMTNTRRARETEPSNQPSNPSGTGATQSGIRVDTRDEDFLDIANGTRLLNDASKRAWRVDGGDWKVETSGAQLTTVVLNFLLGLDARSDDEPSLATVHNSIVHSASKPEPSRWYEKLPSFSNLYYNKNVGNKAKIALLKAVAGRLQLDPLGGQQLGTGRVAEVWLVPRPPSAS